MAEKRIEFKAIANVGFSININSNPDVKSRNEDILKELKQHEGDDVKLPVWTAYFQIAKDQVLSFGESLVLNDGGNVIQLPFSIFDKYSEIKVELPCKMRGNVEQGFEKMLAPMSQEMREEMLRKKESETARFHYVPMLTKVK